ncbi:MAG TPA: NAD(+) synthase [Lachnospiraceae bacterium]|nr:NAD(+) synthase [Lachnospiraceae bacterium]
MQQGFVKAAAGTPKIKVADCVFNKDAILAEINIMAQGGAKIMVFPELCITGYDCRDLFWQEKLLSSAKEMLFALAAETREIDALIFVGLPFEKSGKLYNTAAALNHGKILGLVPKSNLPTYSEFYEGRHFTPGDAEAEDIEIGGEIVPFGTDILFQASDMPHLIVAAEICEDLWVPYPPSVDHVLAGASVVVNLSASDELVGKGSYRRQLVRSHSASCISGYIYATAGEGESSTDLVFGGQNMIAENGSILAEAKRFRNETIYGDIDVDRMISERRRMTTFPPQCPDGYTVVPFDIKVEETKLNRSFDPHPFVPADRGDRDARCDEILNIQSLGLKKRLESIGASCAVVGISGGLDSTLALLVTARAFDMLGLPRENILSVTMPCFGTTDRTYTNAVTLTHCLNATLMEIPIQKAVMQHFKDIGHDPDNHDVTYENSQARQRTLILMDLANEHKGIVIGTGDLSELALGWATYNGDHMSMYAVNASVPKTLVRHLVRYFADTCRNEKLNKILLDVLDTPVSPELLPPTENGTISQKTEDLVGPYELHDFFLYYMLRMGFPPAKIYRLACLAFAGSYTEETILKWLKKFYWRFFSQQFKRSCLPDGPKVGSVAVSPRGDLRMPSDACVRIWMDELEEITSRTPS